MITKEQAYKKIEDLVTRFEEQFSSYKKSDYNETLTRRDFIDPFFKALGWDIDNEQGYAEAYREVIHEDKIKIGNATKAPDYSFRIGGGKRLFFVEAKKPSVDVKGDIAPAYQVRRYGWSAKLPISIITDFEEFAVYDCTKKPNPTDKASVSRINYLNFKDYLTNFDFLWDTFSKEKVLKGSFDKYVQSTANKKGTATVDKEFLQSLDTWRTLLAENFAKCNKDLDEDEINFVVQQTIDRLIFLRIAEDRGVEPYGNLQSVLKQGDYYKNLFDVFRQADDKYNSGLFDFKKDTISKNLSLENKVIKTIINQLYYPESPYEFSVLSVEILGSAYEQFLGKQITLSKTGKAIIEEKPDVRKSGGVYYTPQYIVDYIVENTLGKLCENKTPKQVSEITVCDPACGSGSFLLGAYQYLLDWHKNYYIENGKANKIKKDSPLTIDGNLTTSEKKRILLNNIYGVDIDVNAVEVTKLSLLLKCMEGETSATIAHQISMFNERVLPTLDSNIKSGNSLIDLDFYETQLDFGEEKKVKPFSWQKAFPNVFKKNGFDVIVGNPPYVKIQTLQEGNTHHVFDYFKQIYTSAKSGNYDLYVLFIEQGYKLLNPNGLLGFIQPHKFFQSEFGDGIRNYVAQNKSLEQIVHFGANQIFDGATTYTCLLMLNKKKNKEFTFIEVTNPLDWSIDKSLSEQFVSAQPKVNEKWNFANETKQNLIDKLNKIPHKLSDITRKIFVGLQTSADKIYVLQIIEWKTNTVVCYSKSLDKEVELEQGFIKPFLMGKDVKRYQKPKPKSVVIFPYQLIEGKAVLMEQSFIKSHFPKGWNYLLENKSELENREKGKFKNTWWQFGRTQNLTGFEVERVITPDIASMPQFTLDNNNNYATATVYSFVFNSEQKEDNKFWIGILNSKIHWYVLTLSGSVLRGGYLRFKTEYLKPFPIKTIDFKDKSEVVFHNDISNLVAQLLKLNLELKEATLETQKEQIQNRISFSEDKINALVYQLYGLNEDEIKIVEQNS